MNCIDLSELYDEPLEPSAMQFTTRPATSCKGCVFARQRVSVCRKAADIAQRAGLDDCDRGVIYVARVTDPRQIDLTKEAA